MKILVLGNGFDLDHGLPTSYRDFLFFCLWITKGKVTSEDYYDKLTPTQRDYVKKLNNNTKLKNRFIRLLENNHLFLYFYHQLERQGYNWIDLEREIKSVIHEMLSIEKDFNASKLNTLMATRDHRTREVIDKLSITSVDSGKIDEISLNEIHNALSNALNDFSQALELYIVNFINTTAVRGVSPDIIDFDATNVLTFNYSQTYERVYGGVHWNEVVDHIHGIAQDSSSKETNIILGVTTHSEHHENNRYVEFEKYFQRITKKTGSKYREWLKPSSGKNKSIEVVFFGHSLDSSDSDVINDFISNPNTSITVYYFDEKAHKDIVANLVEIIGKQKLIEYVSGKKPKISFKKQRDHQHTNTAGVEIERDIRKIYRLYSLKDKDAQKLFDKINKRMIKNKLSYFFSQRKVIDLFDALEYVNANQYELADFFAFCEQLDFETSKQGDLIFLHYEDWCGEYSWGETNECSEKTKKLIDLVNKSNKNRFQLRKKEQPFARIHDMKTVDEIQSALLEELRKEPSDKNWKNLNDLMYRMVENKRFAEAIDCLSSGTYPVMLRSRVMHLVHAYYDISYRYHEMKEWEREEQHYSEYQLK